MAVLLGGSGMFATVGHHHSSGHLYASRSCVLFAQSCKLKRSTFNLESLAMLKRCPKKLCSSCLMQKSAPSLHSSVAAPDSSRLAVEYTDLHHVGLLCQDLERSLDFYCGVLGLQVNNDRPADKLPYRGAWLWVGDGMIHLMELPNPDPISGRPSHGGRDRHTCVAIKDVNRLKEVLDRTEVPYTASKSGRPAIFTRDPDGNALEFAQFE